MPEKLYSGQYLKILPESLQPIFIHSSKFKFSKKAIEINLSSCNKKEGGIKEG